MHFHLADDLMEYGLMSKKDLTEQEIRTRYITPAIRDAKWPPNQIREEVHITNGQIHPRGQVAPRGKRKFADYVLYHHNHPLALCDALAAEVASVEEVRARLLQKETAHYAKWRDTVAEMMADPRSSVKYDNVFPDDPAWG